MATGSKAGNGTEHRLHHHMREGDGIGQANRAFIAGMVRARWSHCSAVTTKAGSAPAVAGGAHLAEDRER
jgi:hypothetical protein